MAETSSSLLQRLYDGADNAAWERFQQLYERLIRHWLRRMSQGQLGPEDEDDLLQDVFLTVLQAFRGGFRYDRSLGPFKGWLRVATANRLRGFRRRKHVKAVGGTDYQEQLAQYEDPASEASRICDEEHDQFVAQRALELIEQIAGASQDGRAFKLLAVDGLSADDVATELGLTKGAVYSAKARVKHRLRDELEGLVDF